MAFEYLQDLQLQAEAEGRVCVVGALIVNEQSQVFVQKRSPDRRLFPGCWDIAGGHVERGETLFEALAREVEEETGWNLVKVVKLVDSFDWDIEVSGKISKNREFDFTVEVSGDLSHPQIEQDKFTQSCWVGESELGILKENRASDDTLIFSLVRKALAL